MGKPSDRLRSAQRPGKNERTRVKKKQHSRKCGYSYHAPGGVQLSFSDLGPKKAARFFRWHHRCTGNSWLAIPSAGEPLITESNSRGF